MFALYLSVQEVRMKIWRSFGSGHSAHLTVIGKFKNIDDAQLAKEVVEDFVNAVWEGRYPDLQAFQQAWEERLPAVTILGPTAPNFDMGIDDGCEVERNRQTVKVSGIRTTEIGGIIRLMLLKYPTEIKITGLTG
jgi:hypothetical protein